MTDTVAPEPTPEQAALIARVRRMMLIAGLTSALAVAVVLVAVGYRLYRGEGSPVRGERNSVAPTGLQPAHRFFPRTHVLGYFLPPCRAPNTRALYPGGNSFAAKLPP